MPGVIRGLSLSKRHIVLAVLVLALLASACGKPALPPAVPRDVYQSTLESSWSAALEAKDYASVCRLEADETQKMLDEAKQALEEARKLHEECKNIVKRIPRRRKSAPAASASKPKEKPKQAEKKPEKEKKPEVPTNNEGPLYSPSDAP